MLARAIDSIISCVEPKILSRILPRIPREITDFKRDEAFRSTVKYVYRRSPFYRRKFDEHGINAGEVRRPSDLGDFYTTPIDIVEHAEEFLCGRPHIVFESSGTTGRNKRVYFTQGELDRIGTLNAMGFFLWGMDENDRIVNAFDFNIWIPGLITQKGLEKSKILCLASGKVDPAEVYKRISTYKFNVVIGEPTWLIKLTEIAEKEGPYPLKFLIGGAEEMPGAARPWMERVWQGAKVRMVYASVESGGVVGCEIYPECGSYHIDENDFFVEISQPDSEGYGEVTFTTLTRTAMPLIRYRSHDISRIIDERCACGVPYRRLARMRGRSDELIVASGGNLYPLMFENILKDVEGITSDWQVVFSLRGIREVMEFNLELRDGVSKERIQEKVFENIKTRYPDLWKNYSISIFEIVFTYHKPASLRAGRKLLRVIDKRYVG